MKTRCLVVDDEPLALEAMSMHIAKLDGLRLVRTCSDAIQAFNVLRTSRIDLMFLDIQMPEMTGLEFLKTIKNPPKVILTTAHREYALDAFDLDVVDYLLKPISFERFMQAVNKYFEAVPQDIIAPGAEAQGEHTPDFIFVRADKKNIKVEFRDVHYIESIKDYVRIICRNQTIISRLNISYLEQQLPGNQFLRIHRSYIIYIPNVEAFSNISVFVPGKEIPIGRHYKNEVFSSLQQLIQ